MLPSSVAEKEKDDVHLLNPVLGRLARNSRTAAGPQSAAGHPQRGTLARNLWTAAGSHTGQLAAQVDTGAQNDTGTEVAHDSTEVAVRAETDRASGTQFAAGGDLARWLAVDPCFENSSQAGTRAQLFGTLVAARLGSHFGRLLDQAVQQLQWCRHWLHQSDVVQ